MLKRGGKKWMEEEVGRPEKKGGGLDATASKKEMLKPE